VTTAGLFCRHPKRLPSMFVMCHSSAVFLVFAASSLFAQVAADCTQFSTNGSTASTYDFHRFYDFRQLHDDIDGDAASASSYGEGHTDTEAASGQSKIIQAAPWVSGWNARDWYRPSPRDDTVDMYYKPSCVSISTSDSPFCIYRSNHPQVRIPTRRRILPILPCTRPVSPMEARWLLN